MKSFSRRALMRDGALWLAGGAAIAGFLQGSLFAEELAELAEAKPALRFGLVTDVHYADAKNRGNRHYRASRDKLREAVDKLNEEQAEFAVELGDLIDTGHGDDIARDVDYLHTIEGEFARFRGDRHYVLGNHCVHQLTKREFLDNCAARDAHYAFNANDFHFVVLDACYRNDGVPYGRKNFDWTDPNIPDAQLQWLERDLQRNRLPTIVFVHQRLDVQNNHGIKNAAVVRGLLEKSKRVVAVFQGHSHTNAHREINGIHYCTLMAMIEGEKPESSAYATANVFEGGAIRIHGFRRQTQYDWS